MESSLKFGTICAKESKPNVTTKPHVLPIFSTSSFEFENIQQGIDIFSGKEVGHVYARYGNPTNEAVAEKIAQLEAYGCVAEASAMMTSSGMSAISTLLLALLQSGEKILSEGNLYGGTTELLRKILHPIGLESVFVNLQDLNAVEHALQTDPSIRLIYFETPSNPGLDCVDIQSICTLAKRYNCYTVADNTFCTAYIQQPLRYGTDFVIHSTTKYLNGHGNSIAGVIIGQDRQLMKEKVWTAMKLLGSNCSPWEAWLTHNGMKTLHLRMEKHSSNALALAEYLEQHPSVSKVNYPMLTSHPAHELAKQQMKLGGGMLSFELKGGLQAGMEFMKRLQFGSLAPTLGDVDTLVLHPASMSHVSIPREMRLINGITDGLIRISTGIEEEVDIIGGIGSALGG